MDLATSATAPREKVLKFERLFEAPPELVFALWSDPQHIVRWWGPEGFGLAHCEMEFREGGSYRFCLKQAATGFENWVRGTYRTIERPRRLDFTYINEDDGHETLVELEFSAHGPNTLMRFRQATFAGTQQRDMHGWGWSSTLDLLADYIGKLDGTTPYGLPRSAGQAEDILRSKTWARDQLDAVGKDSRPKPDNAAEQVLEITRVFEAPAALLFKLWSEPEHLVRWLPEGLISLECEVDFRVGGRWQQVFGSPQRPDYRHSIFGVYRDIAAPHRLAMTYVNDYDQVETLVTLAFRELGDGRTEMRFRQEGFTSIAERDGHGGGWRSSFDVLAAYLLRLGSIEVTPAGRPGRDAVAEDVVEARRRQTEQHAKAGRD
jgi:uncharacterized protein YndB with AHSA1/START domain